MPIATCMSAQCKCSMGTAPSDLMVLPVNETTTCGLPAATIMDHAPMVNILPFGLCISLANPVVAAATAADLGVLTPMPCIPATSAPWIAGSPTVTIKGMPALANTSILMCNWAGVIEILSPGEEKVMVP